MDDDYLYLDLLDDYYYYDDYYHNEYLVKLREMLQEAFSENKEASNDKEEN